MTNKSIKMKNEFKGTLTETILIYMLLGAIGAGLFSGLVWACEKEKALGIHGKSSAAIGERIEK